MLDKVASFIVVKQESFIARSKMAKISVNELYAKKQTTFVMQSVFQLFLFLVFSQCFPKDCCCDSTCPRWPYTGIWFNSFSID